MERTLPNLISSPEILPYGLQAICSAVQTPLPSATLETMMTANLGGETPIFEKCLKAALAYELIQEKKGRLHALVPTENVQRTISANITAGDPGFLRASQLVLSFSPWSVGEQTKGEWQKTDLSTVISNATQWANFSRWMLYLGLVVKRGGRLMPDPTQAVYQLLPEILPQPKPLPAAKYFSTLTAKLPLPQVEPDVAPALSLTLMTLEQRGALKLVELSDAPKFALDLPSGRKYFTHLQRGEQ